MNRQSEQTQQDIIKFYCPICEYTKDVWEGFQAYQEHLEEHLIDANEEVRKISMEINRVKNLPK